MDQSFVTRVQRLWEHQADAPEAFARARPISVVVSPASRLGPPSWIGIVAIGDAALVTVPTQHLARRLQMVLKGLSTSVVADPSRWHAVLPITDVLGPATLAYLTAEDFRAHDAGTVERMPVAHPDVGQMLTAVTDEDAGESGITEITSPAFVVCHDGQVVAAAGYQNWLDLAAHLSVLTVESMRGRGLARVVASAATRYALEHGLLPQWRARPAASRRVAQQLGFREVGVQLSLRIGGGQ